MSGILFLAHRIPYPPDKGDKIRSWHMLKHLAERVPVHLGAFVDDPADWAHEPFLRERCASVMLRALNPASRPARAARGFAANRPLSVALFDDAAMRAWVASTLRREDVGGLLAFSGQMAPYILPHTEGRRSAMDFVDLDSAKWAQYAARSTGARAWLYAREARRLAAFERAVAARVDATLFVSEAEAALFRAGGTTRNVHALGNGVDLDFFSPAADFARAPAEGHDLAGPIIAFVGAMDYRPNAEAAAWFADNVWPRVREPLPHARFFVVGSKPPSEVQALSRRAGIVVTGRVADVRPYLAAAAVVVAPLRIARGIQNKVLEAMAMARPVVASPQAFEGIDATPARDLLVEGAPAAAAAAILRLIAEPGRAAQLGAAARLRMEARYQWATNLELLDKVLLSGSGGAERWAA